MTLNLPYQDKPSRWSSHSLIVARLKKLPAESKVLDVGTASGMLARMCQDNSFHFFGVELNPEWAQMADPYYEKIWVGHIAEIAADALSDYDAVVLGDVLEHLPAPEMVLQKLIALQDSGSTFLISVPNIANFWVRFNLLLGHFDYTDRGILDRTHLRFFTRKTLIEMINHSGLKIVSLQATPIPLELVSKFFVSPLGRFFHAILAKLTSLFPTLLGYQFIVEARKP
jgi:2-polyprenyl-3-methyl-5-hydroxy-6-metoxy-1,4-benzoquinol methylase